MTGPARSTKGQVVRELKRLYAYYGGEEKLGLSQARVDEDVEALLEFTPAAIAAAVTLGIRSTPFLPKIAELIRWAREAMPDETTAAMAKTIRHEVSEMVGYRRRMGDPDATFWKVLRAHRAQCEVNLADEPAGPWDVRIRAIDLIEDEDARKPADQGRLP